MKTCKDYKTHLYKEGSFYIEIRIFQDDRIEAWLQHEDYSISQLLFGGILGSTYNFSYDDFIQFVENDLDDYIKSYTDKIILKKGV